MREVVQLVTCDMGGEQVIIDSDADDLETITWSFDGQEYSFETCDGHRDMSSHMKLDELMNVSSLVTTKAVKKAPKASSGAKTESRPSDSNWSRFETERNLFKCTACGRDDFKKPQSLGMHVVRQGDEGHRSLYESVRLSKEKVDA